MKKTVILTLILFLSGCMMPYPKYERTPMLIKVELTLSKANRIEVKPNGNYDIYEGERLKGSLSANRASIFGIYKGKRVVIAKDKIYDKKIHLKGKTGDEIISLDGKKYRGNLYIMVKNNRFIAVNEINVDDYVYGVICKEISASWPEETIKAQAVAARTYALASRGKHRAIGADLCDTQHCQVYGGMSAEKNSVNKLVDKTRGQILTYNRKCAHPVYHSSCGGHTENAEYVWNSGSHVSYLKGRRCKFCKHVKGTEWKIFVPYDKVTGSIKRAGYKIGDLSKVRIKSFFKSGSVREISLMWKKHAAVLSGSKFRSIFGLKSTKFRIKSQRKGIEIKGKGFGHGVGLCQKGAKKMGEKGYLYDEILYYYFPGTEIKGWHQIRD